MTVILYREVIRTVQEILVTNHNSLLGFIGDELQQYLSETTTEVVEYLKNVFSIDLTDEQIFDKVEEAYLQTWEQDHVLQKIKAIKRYRELTCAGLREAKDFVERVVAPRHGEKIKIEIEERERYYNMTNSQRYR